MNRGVRYLISILIFLTFFILPAYGFELKGLQPVQPNGGFSAFSASTSGKGVFSSGIDMEKSIETNFFRTTAKVGYGITQGTDILLSYAYNFDWQESVDGPEDFNIGVKQNFFREKKYGPSVAYLLKLSLGTGKKEFSTDGAAGAGLLISKKLGPFNSHLNFIFTEPFEKFYDSQIEIIFSVALRTSHDVDVVAEMYAVNSFFNDEFDTMEGRLGYRIKTAENIYTVLAAGRDFRSDDPQFRLMISFNFVYGGKGSASEGM